MKNSAKTALGGMVTALSVTMMLLTAVVPNLQYAMPAMAGTFLVIMVIEINKKWAFCSYVAVSLLSFLILTDKETAIMYIAFFGYYPILKPFFEDKIKNSAVCWILKAMVFNAAAIAAYFVIVKVFGIPIDDMETFGKYTLPILLALANVMFVLYDICITRLVVVYLKRWQKKFMRIFKTR